MTMIGLVDCNSFYVSCERVFQPRLRGQAVGVLSNTTVASSPYRMSSRPSASRWARRHSRSS